MNATSPGAPLIVPPGSGRVLRAFDEEVVIHLGGAETGGQFAMWTETTPPGGGPPPHWHDHEDEWFYPLEGRVEFFIGGAWTATPIGSVVFIPKGTLHTFRNPGDRPLKMLIQTRPAGFEAFFARCAEEFARGGPPDMPRILSIAAEHGIHFTEA